MVSAFGLWDQIRVDKGREWYLTLYVNNTLSHLRGDTCKPPHFQTSSTKVRLKERFIGDLWLSSDLTSSLNEHLHYSTCLLTLLHPIHLQNHTIERLWVEINSRINYPIKAVLIEMLEGNQISTEDPAMQYCVSWFAMQVCNVCVSIFVSSWNSHPIPG